MALELFNSEGVENVSTRRIATALGISVGNLHYHFPNKVALIRALQDAFLSETDEVASRLQSLDPHATNSYVQPVAVTFSLIHTYRFLFNDRLTLARKIPEVEEMFRKMVERRRLEFHGIVDKLQEEGLLRDDLPPAQFNRLFQQIVMLYNSWGAHVALFLEEELADAEVPAHFAEVVASIWIPYFSAEGLEKILGGGGENAAEDV